MPGALQFCSCSCPLSCIFCGVAQCLQLSWYSYSQHCSLSSSATSRRAVIHHRSGEATSLSSWGWVLSRFTPLVVFSHCIPIFNRSLIALALMECFSGFSRTPICIWELVHRHHSLNERYQCSVRSPWSMAWWISCTL